MFGKAIARGTQIHACCTKPNFVNAYIWFKFFPAVMCKNCGEITGPLGSIVRDKIFQWFFAPFWNGKVWVDQSQLSKENWDRIMQFGVKKI